jgi:DNA-binding MarR family transcriptional regulator
VTPQQRALLEGGEGLAAWINLLQVQSVIVDALERDLAGAKNIPLPWLEVLMQVTSAPDGRLKMQELAHSVLLSNSGVTRLVDRMVDAGLLERVPCPTDRRSIYAVSTVAGRAALRAALPVHGDSLRRHFSEVLTPAEIGMLRSTFTKILNSGGFVPTPCPSGLDEVAARPSRRKTASKR